MQLLSKLPLAINFEQYLAKIDHLHSIQQVTGAEQSEDLLQYSLHNRKRMERLKKTFHVNTEIQERLQEAVQTPLIWLTITEGWCGDASQLVPIIEAMAQTCNQVQHRILIRDEHLDIIDQFLTNGGRAIPKVLVLDATTAEVLGHWGPRPTGAQEVMENFKLAAKDLNPEERAEKYEQAKLDIHVWYAHDKGMQTQNQFVDCIEACKAKCNSI